MKRMLVASCVAGCVFAFNIAGCPQAALDSSEALVTGGTTAGGDTAQVEDVDVDSGGDAGDTSPPPPANSIPTVSAGSDQAVDASAAVILTATASDGDGDPLTYIWAQTAGAPVALSGTTTSVAGFVAPETSGTLTFEVSVSDGHGGSATDAVSIDVTATPILFITNYLAPGVIAYEDPAGVNGNIAPDLNLSGASTQLSGPADLVVTSSGDMLVANYSSAAITVYVDAPTAHGNLAPDANVFGAATQLVKPTSIALDSAADRIFVCDRVAHDVKVYDGASDGGFIGNLPPTRRIHTTTSADLNQPFGVNLDAAGNLYVANSAAANVLMFDGAGSLNGDVTPSRILNSPDFAGALVYDVFVDLDDRLYVLDGAGRVLMFNDASSLNGMVSADVILTVSVPGALLASIIVDREQNGYIVDAGNDAIYSYDAIQTRNGLLAPDRTIAGPNTQMNQPMRMFLMER